MATKRVGAAPEASDREIFLSRSFDAPIERVWRAWTDPKQLEVWWGPNGFSNSTREISVKAGGQWDFTMHGPDGRDYPNHIAYKEVVERERIVYEHRSKKGGPVGFHVTVTFKAAGKKTEVTMRSVFPSAVERDRVVKVYDAVEGGKQTLGRLADLLAQKPPFELVIERLIDAPRARVYDAWTKPEHLKQWFAPKPFQLIVTKMDFRPGGRFIMAMRGPDGSDFAFTGVYRVIEPPSKLVWTGEFSTGPADQMTTTVTFAEEGGKTRLRAVQTFHVMTTEIGHATKGAKQGWGMTLDQLAAFCK